MQKPSESFFNTGNFVPELRDIFAQPPLDFSKMVFVAVRVKNPDEHGGQFIPAELDRNLIGLSDGENVWNWEVSSLRVLFRGNRQPPVLGEYPEAYNDVFAFFDLHALEISKYFGDRRDTEMKEIFSLLRRRPDGSSQGFVHDYFWQAAALILGTQPLSQAEFEAIMARLERSCRTFERGPTSRNFIAALKNTFD